MTLDQLVELGCYVNAGHVDHFDGKRHTRLGIVTLGGDLIFDAAGIAYAESLVGKAYMAVLTSTEADELPPIAAPAPAAKARKAKAPKADAAEPEAAEPPAAGEGEDLLAGLGDLGAD